MSGTWSTCSWDGFHIVISLSAEAGCQVPFNSHIYSILLPTDKCSCLVYVEIAPLGLAKSLIPALPSQKISKEQWKRKKKYYVNTILDSKYSSAALSLRQHWPGNRLNRRHFSLPYSFIRGIYFVTGLTAGIQNPRRGGRIRNDLSGHGRPVLCVDRWSETSHFWNEGNHKWNGRRT